MSKPDFYSEEETYVGSLDHKDLREVVGLLLERMNLSVMRETRTCHGDDSQESFRLDEKTPKHKHDCPNCTFLGRYFDHDTESLADLYYCPQGTFPTVIARHSSEPADYTSGIRSENPALQEAKQRAQRKGLVK